MLLEYKRLRSDIVTPTRSHPSDAGLDVYYNPTLEDNVIILNPTTNFLFPTGVSIAIPHGYVLMVCNRSSIAAKKRLVYGAHVIDPGYEGEIFIDLHNIGFDNKEIGPGDKIAQLVLVPCVHFDLIEVEDPFERPLTISRDRGDGGFGSTDS